MNTPDNSNIGYFVEADPKNPDEILEKTKNLPYAPEKMKIDSDLFTPYMNENKPNNFTRKRKLIFDWTDKKTQPILFRMLKFYVRLGMVVEAFMRYFHSGYVSGWKSI